MTIEEVKKLRKEYEKIMSGLVAEFQHRTGLEVTDIKFESQVHTVEYIGMDPHVELAAPKINMEVRV